jgi:hypothetical protein
MADTIEFALSIHSEAVVSCDGTACPPECPVCNKEIQP